MATALGIRPVILPMTDSRVATVLDTSGGMLAFQDYFVGRRQQDDVLGVIFEGIDSAKLTEEAEAAIDGADVIVFCPSNPIVSIGPILALAGARERIAMSAAVKVAVSPIVGGRALKGPADRMLTTLGHESSASGVAKLYRNLVDVFVIDTQDASERAAIEELGMRVVVTNTIMGGRHDRERLAREVLDAVTTQSGTQ